MNSFLVLIFFSSVFLLAWSYLIYPILLQLLAPGKNRNAQFTNEELPPLAIVMAAHNEEKVLREKIESILQNDYPHEKLEIWIGSDCSTDQTNNILDEYAAKDPRFNIFKFTERQGKPAILNQLVEKVEAKILVLTDANVFFEKNLLKNLARNFKEENVGLVAADIVNTGLKDAGISKQEDLYIRRETMIKFREGTLFGTLMGPFGACYAMRKDCFAAIPAGYIVDDFYLCMKVYEQKKEGIVDLEAICYEDVSNVMKEEFRRKTRISIGNYQNFRTFSSFLFNRNFGLSFSYISHKVLRWFGPHLLLLAFFSNLLLVNENDLFRTSLLLQCLFYLLFFVDKLLQQAHIHIKPLRLVTHFIAMNAALFSGFIKFVSGNYAATWKPTQRNQ